MREIETDYLVVGAGASGMAFVDALVDASADAEVVMVDRRHGPGGHWLDAYPFVRLHQPSANYGVNSRRLGHDRIDETGLNAGFYERATSAEICDYFARVLYEDLLPSGRVQFLGLTDYLGSEGNAHRLRSLLTGEDVVVSARRRFVDATYIESSIPSRHTPSFTIDPAARFVPPNDLVQLAEPASGFTIIGAGKTALDTCNWLLDEGVDPDSIQWFRPRDPWLFDRASFQPLEKVGSYMHLQASWVRAAALAEDGADFTHRLEDDGILVRISPEIEPAAFRGATISTTEMEAVRTVERVVRGPRVQHIDPAVVRTDQGDIASGPNQVYVDCTAAGVRPTVACPIFTPERITVQYVTLGIAPWSAATIGRVEARADDDHAKNNLCPPLQFTGHAADLPEMARAGMSGLVARGADPEMGAWAEASRLNPARGAADHLDDPRVGEAFATMGQHIGDALANLERLAGV